MIALSRFLLLLFFYRILQLQECAAGGGEAGGKWSGGEGVGACQPILVTAGKCLRLVVNRNVVKLP